MVGILKAASVGLGFQPLAADLGLQRQLHVPSSSSAAIGIARRRGIGRIRRLDTEDLWIQEKVRNHIMRLVRYDGHIIWRPGERADSEKTNEITAGGQDGQHWTNCRCDPVRDIVEEKMLPRLSDVLSQHEIRRWLLPLRRTIWICPCGNFYMHLWKEALVLVIRQRRALREYLHCLYSRLLIAGGSERFAML